MPQLARTAGAVAYGGNILSFDSPSSKPNISYEVTAYAPLVRCQTVNETEQSRLLKGATNWVLVPLNNSAKWPDVGRFDSGEIGYLAVYDEHDNVTMGGGGSALFDSIVSDTTKEYHVRISIGYGIHQLSSLERHARVLHQHRIRKIEGGKSHNDLAKSDQCQCLP
jgi:hypothetical protein